MYYYLNLTTIFLITKSNRTLNKTSLLYWSERKFLLATKGEHIISATQIVKPTTQDKKRSKKDIAIIENIFDKYIQKAYDEGRISGILTTNLTYRMPELLRKEWYIEVDCSKYIAYFILALHKNHSVTALLDPHEKISNLLKQYREDQEKRKS